jgi:hypothetical protein
MSKQGCEDCAFRAHYDKNPTSFRGRLWRWHVNWCPGWKAYMKSLPEDERTELARRYNLRKYLT